VTKGFHFNVKNIEEDCPNLAKDKKSFISFDEIMKKIETKKKSTKSFIESNEQT